MKKTVVVLVLLLTAFSSVAYAAGHGDKGMPASHGKDGLSWGEWIVGWATSNPLFLGEHLPVYAKANLP